MHEAALASALQSGKLKSAALDVFATEPPGPGHPLVGLENVLHTLHLGASALEAQSNVASQVMEEVLDLLRGWEADDNA